MIKQIKDILGLLNVLGRVRDYMTFTTVNADPDCTIACRGWITIETVKNGSYLKRSYQASSPTLLTIEADAGTEVKIKGQIVSFAIDSSIDPITAIDVTHAIKLISLIIHNSSIDHLDLHKNYQLTTLALTSCGFIDGLDVQNCPLSELNCDHCSSLNTIYMNRTGGFQQLILNETAIPDLDLSGHKELTHVELLDCTDLAELDISGSPDIETLLLNGCSSLYSIRTRAQSAVVAAAVADVIQANAGLNGVVYTDPDDPYYSEIETAATNYGWTIEQL